MKIKSEGNQKLCKRIKTYLSEHIGTVLLMGLFSLLGIIIIFATVDDMKTQDYKVREIKKGANIICMGDMFLPSERFQLMQAGEEYLIKSAHDSIFKLRDCKIIKEVE